MNGEFSDDDWDVSEAELKKLEEEALVATQSQTLSQQRPPSRGNDNSSLNNVAADRRDRSGNLRKVAAGNLQHWQGNLSRGVQAAESFDNPSLDEDGVPEVVEVHHNRLNQHIRRPIDETTAREQWRQGRYAQRYGPAPQIPQNQKAQYLSTKSNDDHLDPDTQLAARQTGSVQPVQRGVQNHHQLNSQNFNGDNHNQQLKQNGSSSGKPPQTELEVLRAEREQLQAEKQNLIKQLQTARGEVSIVRKRTEAELKSAERQTEMLKKQIQEESQRHKASLLAKEATVKELATANTFLQHEVEEQNRKTRPLQHAREEPLNTFKSPRKNVTSNLRDGFDDDEIMLLSPSRSPAKRRTSKPSTPTKKRKQPAADGKNAQSLTLRLSGEQSIQFEDDRPPLNTMSIKIPEQRDFRTQQYLHVLQTVMAHRPEADGPMVVESLVKFTFPSNPKQTLSVLLLEEMAKLKAEALSRDLMLIFMRLLARCLAERYHKPAKLLMSCVVAVMDADPTFIDKETIEGSMPTLQSLVSVNASRRYVMADRYKVWTRENPKPREDEDVSTHTALEIMFTIASLIVDEPRLIDIFWRWADTHTILLLLHSGQRLEDILLTLDILSTSVLPTTFGVITTPPEDTALQARTIEYIVDKLFFLLWDPPRRQIRTWRDDIVSETPVRDRIKKRTTRNPEPAPEPALTRAETCTVRLKALDTIMKLSYTSIPHPHKENVRSHHGTTIVLRHINAVARLIRFLHDEVYELCQNHLTTHHLHAELINRVIVLIHHVLLSPQATDQDSGFSLNKCLSGTLVGVSKFRVVMTKLALARDASLDIPPDQGLDSGITEHTRDLAREILAEYITPDEATQLTAAFGVMDVEDDPMVIEEPDVAEASIMAGT